MLYNSLIDTFLETAREGSFSKAAKNLYITQPALTHQIKTLEKSMGTALFIRTSKGVELSKAGKVLFDRADELKKLSDIIEKECRRANGETDTVVRIGICREEEYNVLNRINKVFSAEQPEISIRFVHIKTDALRALINEDVDVIIYTPPVSGEPGYETEFTYIGELLECVLMPPEHRLANKPFVTLADLHGEKLVVPRYGIFRSTDGFIDYVRSREPEITLIEADYDVTTKYQCLQDKLLMLFPQLFSENCSPMKAVLLNSGLTTFFGLLTRKNAPPVISDYICCASKVFQDYRKT